MLNRKLLEVLQRLNPAERARLRQFLLSPFFNGTAKASQIVQLYDLIVQHGADDGHPALEKSAVFRQFFPNSTFEAKTKSPLDSLTTELFHLVRRFLAQVEMQRENGEIYEYWAMAKFCRKYALEDRFWQNIQQARNIQADSSERDAPYFFNQFRIEEEVLNFRGLYNSFEDDANLYAAQENLDKYYSILKLDLTSALEHQKRFIYLSEAPAYLLNEAVMTLSEPGCVFDMPINQIYRLIIKMTQDAGEEHDFEELERLAKAYRSQISPDKYNNIMAFLRNVWVKRHRQMGQGDVNARIFEMYRTHLEEGYLYFENSITLNSFYNLTFIALKLREFEWVRKFFEDHPPERICGTRYPQDLHSLCLAEYHFAAKNYDEAEQTLVYRLFENTLMSISADVLLIKIYHETNNELLETRMGALYKKVKRSKFADEKKEIYLNFLRKLDKIIKYGWMNDSPKRLKLIEEIKTLSGIASREWLLEKLS